MCDWLHPMADEAKLSELFEILELKAHRNHFPGRIVAGSCPARRVSACVSRSSRRSSFSDEPLASLDDALAGRLREQIAHAGGTAAP